MNKRELSKVFSRLAKEEVNLGTHRVELTFVQDIQKLIREIEDNHGSTPNSTKLMHSS